MRTTIDRVGRIVIPKAIRDAARLEPGAALEVRVRDGVVEIEPAPVRLRLERRGDYLVAVPEEPVPPLGVDVVDRAIGEVRRERG